MNNRLSKKIRKKALQILVEWIQLQVPEEEARKINITNVIKFMPPDTHLYTGNKIILSAYSYRWIIKKIKKLIKEKNININNMLLEDIKAYSENRNVKRSNSFGNIL
tara:strand:+ start:1332 stop:1652 length:321 start_codon:yes stop_codon:yes gene_type:complete